MGEREITKSEMLKKKENKHNKERGGRVYKVKHEQEISASSSSQNAINKVQNISKAS